jgi:hypothetical protein
MELLDQVRKILDMLLEATDRVTKVALVLIRRRGRACQLAGSAPRLLPVSFPGERGQLCKQTPRLLPPRQLLMPGDVVGV